MPRPPAGIVADARSDFRPTAWQAFSDDVDVPRRRVVRDLVCPAATPDCEASCLRLEAHAAAKCALDLAYADDAEARSIALELLETTGAIAGVDRSGEIDGAYLGMVPIRPVLPVGAYRRHLAWVRDALVEIERVFATASKSAEQPVLFRTRPHAFRFYRTEERSFPSAYATEGFIGYNVEGPLFDSLESVTATLLHELFHLNDEGHGDWSDRALQATFERIVETCGDDDACLAPYAPVSDRVPGGTYYAFDPRTRDVREYAAEVALRWFREARAMLDGTSLPEPSFVCGAEENAIAWRAVIDEFFGGLEPTPSCAGTEGSFELQTSPHAIEFSTRLEVSSK